MQWTAFKAKPNQNQLNEQNKKLEECSQMKIGVCERESEVERNGNKKYIWKKKTVR